jgi:RNA polymerase sigma-70 factor (ECF subfamily)
MVSVMESSSKAWRVKTVVSDFSNKNWEAVAEQLMAQQTRAFHVACRIIGNRAAAEDAVQEANISAISKLRKGFKPNDLAGWFMTVVINTARNQRRAERRLKQREEKAGIREELPTDDRREELSGQLRKAMSQLAEQERLPISLRYELGMSLEEVSRVLKVTRNVADYRISKGLERLRFLLGADGRSLLPAAVISLLQSSTLETAPTALLENAQSAFTGQSAAVAKAGASASLSSKFGAHFAFWTVAGSLILAAVGGTVWQATTKQPTAAPQDEKTFQPTEPLVEVSAAKYEKVWTFENGPAADLKVVAGMWHWQPADGDDPAMMVRPAGDGVAVELPPETALAPVKITASFRPLSFEENHTLLILRGTDNRLQPCRVWSKKVNFKAKLTRSMTIYRWACFTVFIDDGVLRCVAEDRPDLSSWATTAFLRNVGLEKIAVRHITLAEIPEFVMQATLTKHPETEMSDYPGMLLINKGGATMKRRWAFEAGMPNDLKVLQGACKRREKTDNKPAVLVVEAETRISLPLNSVQPFMLEVRAFGNTTGAKGVLQMILSDAQGFSGSLKKWSKHTVITKQPYAVRFYFDGRYVVKTVGDEPVTVIRYENPFANTQICLVAKNHALESIEYRVLSREEFPGRLRNLRDLLKLDPELKEMPD